MSHDIYRGHMAEPRNIDRAEIAELRGMVDYQSGQIVGKTLAQNDTLRITLFAFAAGEEISTRESGGDALVTCLDGMGHTAIDREPYLLHEGTFIAVPTRRLHAVCGEDSL